MMDLVGFTVPFLFTFINHNLPIILSVEDDCRPSDTF